jgi:hypothetical protein
MTRIARPNGAPTDWPQFPEIALLRTDELVPAKQRPDLNPSWHTWHMVTPHVLTPDVGDLIDA